MANAATAENVNADMRPPDYRFAVQQVRGAIEKKKDKIASTNGEIADVWAKIEGKGVNKKGAKFFAMLDKCEPAERMDILRSVNGCCDAAGWPETGGDMVDEAEGKLVPMRVGATSPDTPGDEEDDAEGDADEEDEPAPEPAASTTRLSPQEALAAAKSRFASGGKVPATTAEYYKGDNSDLAGDPDFDR